jgi:hypothetical protein
MADSLFNAAYYLARNPDVAAAGYTLATAEQHYLRYGAVEGRTPNTWFDAAAYLAAYPDLATHGVTAATALQHYIAYGINESRSPAANVNPANFSYADYATANPDLKAAFGITDPAHLTADQQHLLFGHFLSFGYLENRPGIVSTDGNSFFAQFDHTPVQSGPPAPPVGMSIAVDGSHMDFIYTGADGDDVFTGMALNVNGTTLNGAGGNDTLHVNFGLGLPAFSASTTVHSIEQINVDYGVTLFGTFTVTTADTPSLAIALKGGLTGIPSNLVVSSGDAALHTITVDGSLAIANLTLNLTSPTLAGVDVTMTGGAGGDTLSAAVGVGHIATLTGGAGNDALNASLGQDLMTGGTGNDIFRFGAGTGAPVNLATGIVDTIFDLASGDTLALAGALGSGGTYVNWAPTLTGTAAAVEANIHTANMNVIIVVGTQGYFMNTGNGSTPGAIIKLIFADGAAFTGQMDADLNGAHFVN